MRLTRAEYNSLLTKEQLIEALQKFPDGAKIVCTQDGYYCSGGQFQEMNLDHENARDYVAITNDDMTSGSKMPHETVYILANSSQNY